jgi:hypothetical protein
LRGKQHAIDEAEEGGLTAAAAAEEDEGFSMRNGQGNAGDDGASRNIVYVERDVAKLYCFFLRNCRFRIHFD